MTKSPTVLIASFSLALGCLGLAACDFSLDGSVKPNGTFDVGDDVDVDNIEQGSDVDVVITAENVFLIDPEEDPPAEHEDDAGHFQIYLDDTDDEPLVITAETNVTVTIPAEVEPGDHKLLCRIHKHNGDPTDVVIEISITVVVTVDEDA
ncbi:MAG: hypothetical protein Q8O67_24505 [Deltaproteobacteria bacterium]|nr:hypothetical protein [Deltaproteobacteria bacterium]